MPNQKIIKLCENIIARTYGDLSDIPYELANSIANTYYKFFKLSNELESNSIPTSIINEENIFKGMRSFSKQLRKLQFKIEIAPNLITQLRKINKLKQPNMYKLWLSVSLDYLKYDIELAMKKSGIRRTIERKLKKVYEIPKLIDSMDLKKNSGRS